MLEKRNRFIVDKHETCDPWSSTAQAPDLLSPYRFKGAQDSKISTCSSPFSSGINKNSGTSIPSVDEALNKWCTWSTVSSQTSSSCTTFPHGIVFIKIRILSCRTRRSRSRAPRVVRSVCIELARVSLRVQSPGIYEYLWSLRPVGISKQNGQPFSLLRQIWQGSFTLRVALRVHVSFANISSRATTRFPQNAGCVVSDRSPTTTRAGYRG
mmetsp:Transcript_34473/g.106552  ORF Transcript_34473/g.106552 Transcript_34473/m.106552 type:complete len:211 (-) Transcript_34473:2155-2787(-)